MAGGEQTKSKKFRASALGLKVRGWKVDGAGRQKKWGVKGSGGDWLKKKQGGGKQSTGFRPRLQMKHNDVPNQKHPFFPTNLTDAAKRSGKKGCGGVKNARDSGEKKLWNSVKNMVSKKKRNHRSKLKNKGGKGLINRLRETGHSAGRKGDPRSRRAESPNDEGGGGIGSFYESENNGWWKTTVAKIRAQAGGRQGECGGRGTEKEKQVVLIPPAARERTKGRPTVQTPGLGEEKGSPFEVR